MSLLRSIRLGLLGALTATAITNVPAAAQQPSRPNIIMIMGDDIGWFNIGAYHRGIMAGRTPNLDRLAAEGMMFTDYYAEASCTAGRANFITGELPIRTGLTTVGQAGAPVGMPDEAPTIATVLKTMGYATGQFGKNHLGDLNQYLPTLHGFDEFFGYLYHLDAMEDPCHRNYPPAMKETVGPRHMLHSWATDADDPTVQPRWGKIGKQRIEDAGELCPKRMETVDDEILSNALAFIDKSKRENKPFFVWLNPTRMHVITHLSDKYQSMRTPQNGWSIEEAGMAQLDDIVGAVMQKVKDLGIDNDTIIGFTTDNGAENFTWPDGGQTPFAGAKGTVLEGGFRAPAILRWPGKVPAGKVENQIMSGLDWFPTFVAAAGDPNIDEELKKGKQLGDRTYKVHLDGYDQTDLITGKGPSKRHEVFYFAEGTLGAVRIDDFKFRLIDQPNGWFGGTVKVDWPIMINLRLDPFERTSIGQSLFANRIGGPLSSGALSSYSAKSANTRKPSSISRRCRRERASISKPSRRSWRRKWRRVRPNSWVGHVRAAVFSALAAQRSNGPVVHVGAAFRAARHVHYRTYPSHMKGKICLLQTNRELMT